MYGITKMSTSSSIVSAATNSLVKRAASISTMPRYFDVGVNLTDDMFGGDYRGNQHHKSDIDAVLQKAKLFNVQKLLLTGSSLSESKRTIELASFYNKFSDSNLYPDLTCTVGVHPCTVLEFEQNDKVPELHLQEIRDLINENVGTGLIKAFGEIGLDYDRFHYTPKEKQLQYFEMQLKLACDFDLPLFLHMRNACDDFLDILIPFLKGDREDGKVLKNKKCLVHSFSGTKQELDSILAVNSMSALEGTDKIDIYISVNGCSLKTEENCEVAKEIPLDRLMIETDAPWCEVRKTHSSYKYITRCPNDFYPFEYNLEEANEPKKQSKKNAANPNNEFLPIKSVKSSNFDKSVVEGQISPLIKSRNEPCLVGFIAEIMSKLKGVEPQVLIDTCCENTERVFG